MKHKIVKTLLITSLTATASIAFAGCKSISVEDYSITGYNQSYAVNQKFSLEGVKLTLTMSDGSIRFVPVTEAMIDSMPDMSTPGNKRITIRYDGEVYYLEFVVVAQAPNPEIIAISNVDGLKTTYTIGDPNVVLENNAKIYYLTSNYKTESADLTIDMISGFDSSSAGTRKLLITYEGLTFEVEYIVKDNAQAEMQLKLQEFLQNYNKNLKTGDVSFSADISGIFKFLKDTTELNNNYSIKIDEQDVNKNKELYDAIIKGVVSSSLTDGTNLDPNNMTSQLKVTKALNSVYQNVKSLDYYEIIVNQNLFSEPDYYYNALARDYICDYFEITSDNGKDAVYFLAFKTMNKIRNHQEIDVVELVKDLDTIVSRYGKNTESKHYLNGLVDVANSYQKENGNKHALSNIVKNAYEFFYYEEFNFDTEEYEIKQSNLSEKYAKLLSNLIYEIECLDETSSYKNSILKIETYLKDLIELQYEIGWKGENADRYKNYLNGYDWSLFNRMHDALQKAKLAEVATFVDSIRDNVLIEYFAEKMSLNSKAVRLLFDYTSAKINNQEIDNKKFIAEYCISLDIDPVPYLEEYDRDGSVRVLSIGLEKYFNMMEEEIVAKDEILDLAKYLESLTDNSVDAEILLDRISRLLAKISENVGSEPNIYDLLAQLTSHGTDYEAILENVYDYIADNFLSKEIPDEALEIIKKYVFSGFEDYDVEEILSFVCDQLGLDKDTYIEEYRNNNTLPIVTMCLEQYLNSLEKDIIGRNEILEIVRYIEACKNNEFDPDVLLNKLKNLFMLYSDDVNSVPNIYDLLAQLSSHGTDYKAVVENLYDYITTHFIPEDVSDEAVELVKKYVFSNFEDYDIEEIISAICDQFNLDKDVYLVNYREHGNCYILRELFDKKFDLSTIEDPYEKKSLESLRDLMIFADELAVGNFSFEDFKEKTHNFARDVVEYYYHNGHNNNEFSVLRLLVNEAGEMLHDLILNGTKNFDVEKFIGLICDEFDLDKEEFIGRYQEFGTCYALREIFDYMIDLDSIEDESEKAVWESVREIASYLDESFEGDFEKSEFLTLLNNFALRGKDYWGEESQYGLLCSILDRLTQERSIEETIRLIVGDHSSKFIPIIVPYFADMINIPTDCDEYLSLENIITTHVDNYVNDNFDAKAMTDDLVDFIETNCDEKVNMFKDSAVALMNVILFDEEADYNEIFKFIPIPDEMEEIDYNKLFESLNYEEYLALINKIAKYGRDYKSENNHGLSMLFKVAYYSTLNKPVEEIVRIFIDENFDDLKSILLEEFAHIVNIEPETEEYNRLDVLLTSHMQAYVDDNFDGRQLIEDLKLFIEENCKGDEDKYAHSIASVLCYVFYDEEIDYNEVLGFIPIPEGMEEIDYNKLIKGRSFENYIEALNKIAKYGVDYKPYNIPGLEMLFKVGYYATLNKPLGETVRTFVNDNFSDIKSVLLEEISSEIEIAEGTDEYEELNYILTRHMDLFINDEFVAQDMVNELKSFINKNCEDEIKTHTNSIVALVSFVLFDEEVDYNELLGFITLPEGMEKIDYNKLIKECNFENYIELINKIAKYGIEYEVEEDNDGLMILLKTIYYASLNKSFDETLKIVIDDYKNSLTNLTTDVLSQVLQLHFDSEEYSKLNSLVEKHIDSYLIDEFNMETLVEDVFNFVNENCNEDVKTIAKSSGIILGAMLYDEGIDYNELLAFIPLPEGIESIDYNKLFKKLTDEGTYRALKISDVEVQHIVENNKLVKEVLTMKVNLNYDLMILASAQAELTIKIEIDL